MSKMIRTMGTEGPIWMVLHHHSPHTCPECKRQKALQYIGFAENYADDFYGKLYLCSECHTWLDCVWPKRLGKMLDTPNADEGMAAV